MKSDIEYYYNIKVEELKPVGDYYLIIINNIKYYFCLVKRPLEDFKDLISISNELYLKKIPVHQFILNNKGKYITTIEDKNYVLLRTYYEEQQIDLPLLKKFQNSIVLTNQKSKLYRNNWGKLWSDKIDYFEYQVNQLGKDKELILNTFSYYIGLAENAISYINNVNEHSKQDAKLTLAHKRIFYPNYALNYFNPLSFIIDQRIRDVAEYIKSAFFQGIDTLDEIQAYFKYNDLSSYEFYCLYARLLYPSYYFDIYEKIMDENLDESNLLKIINFNHEYEIFLKKVYLLINKYTYIEPIDWLL